MIDFVCGAAWRIFNEFESMLDDNAADIAWQELLVIFEDSSPRSDLYSFTEPVSDSS